MTNSPNADNEFGQWLRWPSKGGSAPKRGIESGTAAGTI
jgi:hypothetical protein